MSQTRAAITVGLGLAACLSVPASAVQQVADLAFDTTVRQPAYATGGPAVFIDAAHHNFHTAEGLYKPFADLLSSDGYRVVSSSEPFSRKLLSAVHVLVISNALGPESAVHPAWSRPWFEAGAKPAFTEQECDRVRDWVRGGGSLLLVADHRPFGASAARMGQRFGIDMRKGYTFDTANLDDTGNYRSNLVFTREAGGLGSHPILEGRHEGERINRVMTFVGQSLLAAQGTPLLRLAATAIDRQDLSTTTPEIAADGRAQAIAITVGMGRVVVLGEAAMITAQGTTARPMGMNVAGTDNRQFALNVLHWLSGLLEP